MYPKNAVYTKDESDTNIAKTVTTALNKHLSVEDPHGTLNTVKEMISDMAKTNGSTQFTSPQTGVDPISDDHLTTKKYVTRLLKEHTRLLVHPFLLIYKSILLYELFYISTLQNLSQFLTILLHKLE